MITELVGWFARLLVDSLVRGPGAEFAGLS